MLYLMKRKLEKVLETGPAQVEVMQDSGTPCRFVLAAPDKAPTFLSMGEDHFECLLQTPTTTFTAQIPYQRIMNVWPATSTPPASPRFG